MFGRKGAGRDELDTPCDVTVDGSGFVYVSEGGNHCVSVFTYEGGFVTSFGRWGGSPGEFHHPYGLAVDSSGVVYMCDYNNYRIQTF
jgi:tripartite motif-containing protein 2/3/tripartite motif-containing protein 71